MQNCKPPSFFLTNTTALYQALRLGQIAPDSSISCGWFQTSSTNSGGICLNHSLKGVLSVTFIVCSIEWVQCNSVGSNENTSWYLAKGQQVASASSGGQESNPLRSCTSNNFPCLCLTVSFGACDPWGSAPSPCSWTPSGGSGIGSAATTLATKGFLLEGLWVSCTVSYHHNCLFTSHLNSVYIFCTVRPSSKESSPVHKACTMMLICSTV